MSDPVVPLPIPPTSLRPSDAAPGSRLTLTAILAVAVIAAILHVGQAIFLPLAFAVLITFALSPLVDLLRRTGLPTLVAVLAAVTAAFLGIGLFLLVVTWQFGQLAQQLPTFQGNIIAKLDALQNSGTGDGIMARLAEMAAQISDRLSAATATAGPDAAAPVQVEVIERQSPVSVLVEVAGPLLSPVATAGLVVVVVIFMLLEREELRDRFIRLVGSSDIHKTTRVISEAGSGVGQYLLTQILVNTIYAVPIGLGLWLIGVPNAVLWGMTTLVLRFVPYIGTFLSAAFPVVVAFAASPDWSMVVWTAALFLVVELVTSNVIEPWLYGSRTGVSALAIIVSAIFWTWIWGPMGLVLSTPLTVCLVVLGRHIPQFEMFDILFGDRPVLAAHSRLYQRLLVGDVVEATFRAEEALDSAFISDFHRDTGLPALLLAEADRERGVIGEEEGARLVGSAMRLLDELDPYVAEELAEHGDEAGAGRRIAVIGGRTGLDDVAARMLGQTLAAEGALVTVLSHDDLAPSRFAAVTGADADTLVIGFLDPAPSRASLLHVRRIKRAVPGLRVGIALWQAPTAGEDDPPACAEIMALGADFCVASLDDALTEVLTRREALPLPEIAPRPARRRPGRAA